MPQLETRTITTRDGHTLQMFYNRERDLLVVDLIHRSEQGGNEIVRAGSTKPHCSPTASNRAAPPSPPGPRKGAGRRLSIHPSTRGIQQ